MKCQCGVSVYARRLLKLVTNELNAVVVTRHGLEGARARLADKRGVGASELSGLKLDRCVKVSVRTVLRGVARVILAIREIDGATWAVTGFGVVSLVESDARVGFSDHVVCSIDFDASNSRFEGCLGGITIEFVDVQVVDEFKNVLHFPTIKSWFCHRTSSDDIRIGYKITHYHA